MHMQFSLTVSRMTETKALSWVSLVAHSIWLSLQLYPTTWCRVLWEVIANTQRLPFLYRT